MNPRYAPAWSRFFHAADKDSAGGSTKTLTVAELASRVQELEAANKTLTGEKAAAEKATAEATEAVNISASAQADLQAKLDAAESAKADLQAKLDAALKANADLQAKLGVAESAKTIAETAATTAKQDSETAKTKANECAAKAGLKPPYTAAINEEGQKQSGDDSAKTPLERLSASMKVAGYEQQ